MRTHGILTLRDSWLGPRRHIQVYLGDMCLGSAYKANGIWRWVCKGEWHITAVPGPLLTPLLDQVEAIVADVLMAGEGGDD